MEYDDPGHRLLAQGGPVLQRLAHLAIRAGADARFMKTSRARAYLAGGRADRTWDKRLRELTRPPVLIDDFAVRELTAPQADDLCELITERAGKSLILTSQPVTFTTGVNRTGPITTSGRLMPDPPTWTRRSKTCPVRDLRGDIRGIRFASGRECPILRGLYPRD